MIRLENAKKYKKQIKNLYVTAFPKEERAPLFVLYHKAKKVENNFYAIVEDDEFAGLVYTIQDAGILYVFFFAIVEEKRGQGYGSKVLSMIKEKYPNHIVTLMIEDTADKKADNYEQRIQRLKFYQRNGFMQLHVGVNEMGVEYELLGTQEGVTQVDFLDLMRKYVGDILFKFIYRKMKLK